MHRQKRGETASEVDPPALYGLTSVTAKQLSSPSVLHAAARPRTIRGDPGTEARVAMSSLISSGPTVTPGITTQRAGPARNRGGQNVDLSLIK